MYLRRYITAKNKSPRIYFTWANRTSRCWVKVLYFSKSTKRAFCSAGILLLVEDELLDLHYNIAVHIRDFFHIVFISLS